jgi:hypothetical protein
MMLKVAKGKQHQKCSNAKATKTENLGSIGRDLKGKFIHGLEIYLEKYVKNEYYKRKVKFFSRTLCRCRNSNPIKGRSVL